MEKSVDTAEDLLPMNVMLPVLFIGTQNCLVVSRPVN